MEQKIILVDRLSRAVFPPESALSRSERVEYARTGSDAISLVSSSPDSRLVIFPYELVDMTAPEFCRLVRSSDASRSTSLLFVGDYGENSRADLCIAAGCNDFVLRPVDLFELDAKIVRLSSIAVRKELRTLTRINLDVVSGEEVVTGHSLNISTTGMLLQMDQVLPPEATVRLHFYLHGEREPLDIGARIVRAEFIGGSPKYGVEFTDEPVECIERIRNFFERQRI